VLRIARNDSGEVPRRVPGKLRVKVTKGRTRVLVVEYDRDLKAVRCRFSDG